MSDLIAHGERVKLARALGVPPAETEYLAPLSIAELRALRRKIQSVLFGGHEKLFRRAAAPARIIPAAVNALISKKVFGPVLSARISGLMPPDKAIAIAGHLPIEFQADISVAMDPRRAQALIRQMPVDIVVAVAREMMKRREFIVMAQYVDDLSDAAIRAVTDRVVDDEALLHIGLYVENVKRLDELTAQLADARLRGVVRLVAKGKPEVQAAGLAMMSQLGPRQQGRIGELAIALGADVLTSLIAAAEREGASDVVRAVMDNVGSGSQQAFVELLADMDPALLAQWAQATTRADLWAPVLKLLKDADAALKARAREALTRLPPAELEKLGALRAVLAA